jgi:hypothetical protein
MAIDELRDLVRRKREKDGGGDKKIYLKRFRETRREFSAECIRGSQERLAVSPDLRSLDRFGKRSKISLYSL